MSKFTDKDSSFNFGRDKNDGSHRQDRYSGEVGSTSHKEHTWSKTSTTSGEHKEGWDGSEKTRTRDEKK